MATSDKTRTLFQGGGGGNSGSGNVSGGGIIPPVAPTTPVTPTVSAPIEGGLPAQPPTPPKSETGFQQAFVPAVSVPELAPEISNVASTTFNDTSNVKQVGEGLGRFEENNNKTSSLPRAGIMSGLAPKKEAVQESPPQPESEKPKPKLSLPKWAYAVIGVFFVGVLGFLAWSLLAGEPEEEVVPTPVPQKRVIEYWSLFEEPETMQPILAEFETETGISVRYLKKDLATYRADLQNANQAGNGPDVFRYHNTWGPMLRNDLAIASEAVYPVADFKNNFYPVAAETMVTSTGINGLPIMYDGLTLLYNKTIFTAAGKVPPTTWIQFREIARDLTVKDENGQIIQSGAAMGLANNIDHFSDVIGVLAFQNGVDLTFAGGMTETKNTTNMAVVLDYYTSFYNDPEWKTWDENMDFSLDAFAAGKVGMILVSSYRINDIHKMNPNLSFGTAKLPRTVGTADPTWASFWTEGVNAKSTKQADAWKLLKYLTSDSIEKRMYNQQVTYGHRIGEIFSLVSIASDLSTNPDIQPILFDAPNAKTFYLSGNTFDKGINDELIEYYQQAITGMTLGQRNLSTKLTAEEAVEQIVSGTTEVLKKYQVLPE